MTSAEFEQVPGIFGRNQETVVNKIPQIRYGVRIDSLGYRGQDFPRSKPDGEFRILYVGDSFVFGDFVDDEETLPAQAERALRSRCSRAVLIINAGVGGPLFYPIRKGGAIQQRQITNQAIYNMLQDRAKQAGIPHCSPHDLRHSFISDLLDRGADIVTVQGLAGHSSVETTASYDRRGERAKKKAIGLLHVPYKRAYKPA